jgi:hypothetical protein
MGEFCLDHEREDQPLDLVLLARAVEEAERGEQRNSMLAAAPTYTHVRPTVWR